MVCLEWLNKYFNTADSWPLFARVVPRADHQFLIANVACHAGRQSTNNSVARHIRSLGLKHEAGYDFSKASFSARLG
jgi:hypothetical protein